MFVNEFKLLYHEFMGSQYYGGLIWTNHAHTRMKERGLNIDLALDAFKSPDKSTKESNGSIKFQKRYDSRLVTVVARQNDNNEWIIISAWVDPPAPGSEDDKRRKAYHAYQKSSFWKKLLITIMRQVGLSRY